MRACRRPACATRRVNPDIIDYAIKRSRPAIIAVIRDPATRRPTGGFPRVPPRSGNDFNTDLQQDLWLADPARWRGVIAFEKFADRICLLRPPPFDPVRFWGWRRRTSLMLTVCGKRVGGL